MIPRIFDGRQVVIAAGGPSLIGFDWASLESREVIAINRAHEFCPRAKVLWWTDAKYWRKASMSLIAHAAPYKATSTLDYRSCELPPTVFRYPFTGGDGFDPDPAALRHGHNSAYAAIHLAAHLGARSLILLGVDMKNGPRGETHFHGGHGADMVKPVSDIFTNDIAPRFQSLADALRDRGIAVVNGSPDSAVTAWPRLTIPDAMSWIG